MTSSWLIIIGHMIYQNDKWVTSFRMMGDSSLWRHDSDYFRFTGNRKFIGFPVSIILEHTFFLLILVVYFVFWYLQPFSRINYKLLDTYKKTDLLLFFHHFGRATFEWCIFQSSGSNKIKLRQIKVWNTNLNQITKFIQCWSVLWY